MKVWMHITLLVLEKILLGVTRKVHAQLFRCRASALHQASRLVRRIPRVLGGEKFTVLPLNSLARTVRDPAILSVHEAVDYLHENLVPNWCLPFIRWGGGTS